MSVPGDRHRAALANDILSQPDPSGPRQLQPEPARLPERSRQALTEPAGLDDHEQRPGPSGKRREPVQPVTHAHTRDRRVPTIRQVHHQQVHGPRREQCRRQRKRLLEARRCEHHEPFRTHAPGHGLHGIECPGEIQPGHDRPRRLRFGGNTQGHGGLAR
jgi:hypothetical protein